MNCCDMYDSRVFFYCDNFPHLDDADGNPCPEGDWPCLFKAADGNDASELMVHDAAVEAVTAFISITGAFALFGIVAAMIGCRRRRRGEDVDEIKSISGGSTSLSPPKLKFDNKEKFDSSKLLRELYTNGKKEPNHWEGVAEAFHDHSGAKKTSDFESGRRFRSSLEVMRTSVLSAPLHVAATETEQSDEPSPRPPDVVEVTRPAGEPVPLPGGVTEKDEGWEVSRQDRQWLASGASLSYFATGASLAAATVSLMEPLQPDVLAWRQLETLRQASGRARCGARSASGPPATVKNAVADTGRAPGTKGARQRRSSGAYDTRSVQAVCNRDWDVDEEYVKRLVGGAAHQRASPAPPKSQRLDSPKGSASTASRSPDRSARSKRPDSSPGSSISNQPVSPMSSPAKESSESPLSSQPQSGRSKLQAAIRNNPHSDQRRRSLGGFLANL